MGLAVSSSSSVSISKFFFLAAILFLKKKIFISAFKKKKKKKKGSVLGDLLNQDCNITDQLLTYLLFADLLEADCFLAGFSGFGWAGVTLAALAVFCLGFG